MAELKKAEAAIDGVWRRYNQLRCDADAYRLQHRSDGEDGGGSLPYVPPRLVLPPPPPSEDGDEPSPPPIPEPVVGTERVPPFSETPVFATLEAIVTELTSLQQTLLNDLHPKRERFAKRLQEKDPVTGSPRYGERTQRRVRYFLKLYHELVEALSVDLSADDDGGGGDSGTAAGTAVSMIRSMQQQYVKEKQEQEERKLRQEEERRRRELEERERLEREARAAKDRLEKERRERKEAELREQELLRRRAEIARAERLEREAADRNWTAGVVASKEGITEQIDRLKKATENDKEAQNTALTSLFRLFKQIQSHPENVQFRRIRRDHEQFQKDIGRHEGGREVLIAAGFELGAIDEVPCFISREPDIEKDMDAWSAWFDLQKAAFDLLQAETERIEEEKKLARRRYYENEKKK